MHFHTLTNYFVYKFFDKFMIFGPQKSISSEFKFLKV